MKKYKFGKMAALVLGLCMVFLPCQAVAQPGMSPDYSTLSDWAKEDVYECWENNIMQPYMARDFKESITREEFCGICVIVISKWHNCDYIEIENVPQLKEIADKSGFEGFSDTNSWDAEFCARLGIVSGMGDGTFRPDEPITREQAAVMLYNTLDIATSYLDDLGSTDENDMNSVFIQPIFNDIKDIQSWAKQEIYIMYNLGVMMGDTNNNFNPQDNYTREQSFCTFLRLYKLIDAPDEKNIPNFKSVLEAEIDYGKSELYSQEDMDKAIQLIKEEFSTWEGCELHNIRYATDACNSQENLNWMNDSAKGRNLGIVFTQCIEFKSDFHSPVNPRNSGAWNIDYEYTDWQWWLARTEDGEWQLMTWGY